jgi:biopolymer transport protein ExbB
MLAATELNYFRILVWPGGGMIGIILWTLSIVMISLIVDGFLLVRRDKIIPEGILRQVRQMFEQRQYRAALDLTNADRSFFSRLIYTSLNESKFGYTAMERALDSSAEEQITRLLRRTEWLNLLGNIGPMVGLLGTVWGLIMTFFAIVRNGGVPDPGQLAGAIGIKLVCTLLGLVVAIPSLAVYSVMRNRIDGLSNDAVLAAQDLVASLRPGARAPAVATASAPAAKPAAAGDNKPTA